MKFLFLFLGLIITSPVIYAQQKIPASQRSQIQKEINELKKDIKELEAEIKVAEKESPEDVADLKRELASYNKMLSVMEKTAGTSPKTTNAKVMTKQTQPVYQSPIVPIPLKQPVSPPTAAQAKDHLLWYKGKKINDSILIKQNGTLILFSAKKNRVVIQPEKKKDPFDKIVKELEKTEQRKNELIEKFSKMKNGALLYPDLVNALAQYDDLTLRYNNAVKNTIELHAITEYATGRGKSGNLNKVGGPYLNMYNSDNLFLEEDWKDVLKEAKKLFDALPTPENDVPAPPEHELSICNTCDSSILKKERQQDRDWSEKFTKKEIRIINMILGVYRMFALSGIQVEESDPDINNSNKILTELSSRIAKKDIILLNKYGKDMKRRDLVIQTILADQRQIQLLGADDNGVIEKVCNQELYKETDQKYMKEQMGVKNYNYVLNIAHHLGAERQKQLLGISDGNEGDFPQEFKQALDFNRFNLSLDMDFIYEQNDDEKKLELKATGNLVTKDKVYVQLFLNDCTWRMMMYDPDYFNAKENDVSIPLLVKSGEKTKRDKDDNLVTYSYSGYPKAMMPFPDFKIDFCNTSKNDTAFLMTLNYPIGVNISIGRELEKSYKADLLALANHMIINNEKAGKSAVEGMELAADIMESLSGSQIDNPTGNPKLDKLQNKYNFKKNQDDFKKKASALGMNDKTVFLFQANNGSTVLIDKYNDTKHTIDKNKKLTKGMIHLRIVHEPVNESNQ